MLINELKNLLKNLPLNKQHSLLVFVVTFIAVTAYLFDNLIADTLVYNHTLIGQGELWRVITGHFLHTNVFHLFLNLGALILLWALHGQFYNFTNYCVLFLISALVCSIGMYFLSPDITQYVGLSGVLHGVFVFGAMMDIQHKDKTGYLLFIGVWLKIAHEQFYGASEEVSSLINASVAIDAHLWGALGGFFYSSFYLLYQRKTISCR